MSTYSIDDIRLNAAKHVPPEFLPLFQEATGEVFDNSVERICSYQGHLTNVPHYPTYFSILYAFIRGSISCIMDRKV